MNVIKFILKDTQGATDKMTLTWDLVYQVGNKLEVATSPVLWGMDRELL